jgi:hypothetical protein
MHWVCKKRKIIMYRRKNVKMASYRIRAESEVVAFDFEGLPIL